MISRTKKGTSRTPLALLAAIVLGASAARADSASGGGWEISFIPYLWVPELHADASVGDREAEVDVGIDDVFTLLFDGDLLGGAGHIEARRQDLTLLADAMGAVVDPQKTGNRATRKFESDMVLVEFGVAYRIFEGPLGEGRTWSVEPLAGGRYVYSRNEITVETEGGPLASPGQSSREAEENLAEPFLGTRFHFDFHRALSWNFAGNVGGFGVGSELSWEIVSFLMYELPWKPGATELDALAGYRLLDFEFEDDPRQLDLQLRGPLLGFGVRF